MPKIVLQTRINQGEMVMECKRKYVYLHELDSVCKTDEDIIIAQKALYNEIAINGNIVVLSYDQIVDSRGFFSLWYDDEYNKAILKLFDKGAIKISQIGDIRTVAQYLINSIQPEKEFVYSAIPLKSSQKYMLAMMRRCLENSDLSDIKYYIELADSDSPQDDKKVQDLFIEFVDGKEIPPQIGRDKMHNVLKCLYSFIEMVLKLSMMPDIYIKPRNTEEYIDLKFNNILSRVLSFDCTMYNNKHLFINAVNILKRLEATKQRNDNRSVYYRELAQKCMANNAEYCQYACAILDLTYNYACEISIANTSKHYKVEDLNDVNTYGNTFRNDFFNRLQYYWREGKDSDARFGIDDSNDFVVFKKEHIPDFTRATRVTKNLKDRIVEPCLSVYEHGLGWSKTKNCFRKIGKSVFNIGVVLLWFYIIFIIKNFVSCLLCKFQISDKFGWFLSLILEDGATAILGIFLFKKVSCACNKFIYLEDYSKHSSYVLIYDIKALILDIFASIYQRVFCISYGYNNKNNKGIIKFENYNDSNMSEYIVTRPLAQYRKWLDSYDNNVIIKNSSEICKIADVNNNALKNLIKNQEQHGYDLGIIYDNVKEKVTISPIYDNGQIRSYVNYINDYGILVLLYTDSRYVLIDDYYGCVFPYGPYDIDKKDYENVNDVLMGTCDYSCKSDKDVEHVGTIIKEIGNTSMCIHVVRIRIADSAIINPKVTIIKCTIGDLKNMIASGKIKSVLTKAVCEMKL